MENGFDRRQRHRIPLPGTVHGTIGPSNDLRLVNLSPAGALIEHPHPLSPGQPCVLDLHLDGAEVHLRAHVAWCQVYSISSDTDRMEERRFRSGLYFTDLSESVAAQLRHYLVALDTQKARPARGPE